MVPPTYLIRNYHPKDLHRFLRWVTEAQERRHLWHPFAMQDLFEILTLPHVPETNLFIAEQAGHLVGYAVVRSEPNIGRIVLDGFIPFKHLRKGLFTKLMDRALDRSKELGAKVVHLNIFQSKKAVRRLFERMGFRRLHRFYELRLDLSKASRSLMGEVSHRCRSLRHEEEDKLVQLQNRSFAGTWGYHHNTREDILNRLHLSTCCSQDVLAVFDGDKPTAYCWTRLDGKKRGYGRIYMLGVDPDQRGRGLGKEVLMAGLAYMRAKGARMVDLTVDSENKVARALYRSVGFRYYRSSWWYEKRLSDL